MPYSGPPAIDVANFDLTALLRFSRAMREATAKTASFDEAAGAITRLLYETCIDKEGRRSCPLVRFYRTQRFESLDPRQRAFARRKMAGAEPKPETRTLLLLASAGDEPAWNDPRRSREHLAIPLASVEMVQQAPMIAGLFQQFGIPVRDVVRQPGELLPELAGKTYNVFHVPEARGSPLIPAQKDFVERYGIASVVGFGGVLRSGDLFAVILFSRRPIPAPSAERFRSLAVDVKGVLYFLDDRPAVQVPARAVD